MQKDKVRPIDGFSAHGHNDTAGTGYTVGLGGTDEVATLAKFWDAGIHGWAAQTAIGAWMSSAPAALS